MHRSSGLHNLIGTWQKCGFMRVGWRVRRNIWEVRQNVGISLYREVVILCATLYEFCISEDTHALPLGFVCDMEPWHDQIFKAAPRRCQNDTKIDVVVYVLIWKWCVLGRAEPKFDNHYLASCLSRMIFDPNIRSNSFFLNHCEWCIFQIKMLGKPGTPDRSSWSVVIGASNSWLEWRLEPTLIQGTWNLKWYYPTWMDITSRHERPIHPESSSQIWMPPVQVITCSTCIDSSFCIRPLFFEQRHTVY